MESPKTPEKCTICLGQMEDRAVIEGCLHAFCYSCLKEWSKIKAVCPLCKHSFTFIMHNIRANDDYDKYIVPKPLPPPHVEFDHLQSFFHWEHETNHVVDHWMSSRIHEWRERIQQDQENYRAAMVAATSTEVIRRRRKYYRDGIQVSYVRNNKRVRDISSRFFRDNPPQTYRLVPWLKRELIILFGAQNIMLVNRVCDVILSALPTLGIRSTDFYNEIKPYFMERTDHFLKEFISFASSPHDLVTYDSNARYSQSRRRRAPPGWSSDDEEEIQRGPSLPHLYSTSYPEPPPLAHAREHVPLGRRITSRARRNQCSKSPLPSACIVISSEESSDDSGIEFVRYIKPPHLRTPDTVINLSSDEEDPPGPSCSSGPPTFLSSSSLSDSSSDLEVKVKLKSVVVPVPAKVKDTSSENDKPTTSSEHRVFSRNRGKSPSSYQRPLKKIFDRKRLSPNNAFTRHLRRRWSSESDDDYTTSYIRPSKQKRNEEDLEKA